MFQDVSREFDEFLVNTCTIFCYLFLRWDDQFAIYPSFDQKFDLTAGVYFYVYNISDLPFHLVVAFVHDHSRSFPRAQMR